MAFPVVCKESVQLNLPLMSRKGDSLPLHGTVSPAAPARPGRRFMIKGGFGRIGGAQPRLMVVGIIYGRGVATA
jgi:hypothetical protein